MINLLEAHLREQQKGLRVKYIEYRNLAPLYAQEPVKVCGRKLDNGKYEVWVETPEVQAFRESRPHMALTEFAVAHVLLCARLSILGPQRLHPLGL
ncbi:hypothetical protein LTS18_003478 [Coniosporium uncinatum]|uniref:Uncharacterized protein n=1 Tax=Coniosporium uncinatum TaxID=93489 RepID=A0ACC3D7B1_9PEZI|nr:hypothetical protein LTS18_003478 [Coniosporium uncinatum]